MTNRRTLTITEDLQAKLLGLITVVHNELSKPPRKRNFAPQIRERAAELGDRLAGAKTATPTSSPEPTGYHTDIFINDSLSHHERLPSLPQLETVYHIGRDSFAVVNHGTRDDDGTRTLELYLSSDEQAPRGVVN